MPFSKDDDYSPESLLVLAKLCGVWLLGLGYYAVVRPILGLRKPCCRDSD